MLLRPARRRQIPFATGAENGDGDQASHWAEAPVAIGIMAADFEPGMIVEVKPADVLAFDVIGWDRVPEPASALLFSLDLVNFAHGHRVPLAPPAHS
jgi:hypothetical protein